MSFLEDQIEKVEQQIAEVIQLKNKLVNDMIYETDTLTKAKLEKQIKSKNELIEQLEGDKNQLTIRLNSPGVEIPVSVFISQVSRDQKDQRIKVIKSVEAMDMVEILPKQDFEEYGPDFEKQINEATEKSHLDILIIGETTGGMLDEMNLPLCEAQLSLIKHSEQNPVRDIIWIPNDLQVKGDKQKQLIERITTENSINDRFEVIEGDVHDCIDLIQIKINQIKESIHRESKKEEGDPDMVYLVCDREDVEDEQVEKLIEKLYEEGTYVELPFFDTEATEFADFHRTKLEICDVAILYSGKGNERWFMKNKVDIDKVRMLHRQKPMKRFAICFSSPDQEYKKKMLKTTLNPNIAPIRKRYYVIDALEGIKNLVVSSIFKSA